MQKNWKIIEFDQGKAEKISKELNVPLILGELLVQRGIETFNEAKSFFRPSLDDLHDPYLMKGMKEAVDRLEAAIKKKEKVLIFGDYDVDGTTSVAMVFHFLSRLSDQLEYYIPDRYTEGYGLSNKAVDHAINNGFSLVITLDCGIKSIDEVARAAESNVDFIVCDHHLPSSKIPEAIAVLDPKQEDCNYPYDELCGCGVGFKLLQGLNQRMDLDSEILFSYLDLVSLAIAADIVPIDGENRVLSYLGLKAINKKPRVGIETLLSIKKKDSDYNVNDLVFTLAPRINAAGRIRSGMYAVQLLIEEDKDEAKKVAQLIEEDNIFRRELDSSITEEGLSMLTEMKDGKERKSTVVYDEKWHKGVVGIVASRLIESYFRPTIVLTRSGDIAAGSARSVPGFDLYKALEACTDHLIQFGGHKHAAGMTLKISDIKAFSDCFEETVRSTILDSQLIPEIKIDLELDLNELNHKVFRIIQQMAPFGPKNPEPVLCTRNVVDAGYSRPVGKDDEHLKLTLRQDNGKSIDGIAFGSGKLIDEIKKGTPFNVAYSLQENTWNGVTKLQLMVKDIQFSD